MKPGNKTNQNDLIDITKSDHSLRSNDQFSLGSKNVNNLVSDAWILKNNKTWNITDNGD